MHVNPEGRPVHPECPAHFGGECQCHWLWDQWDGNVDGLNQRIDAAQRAELRRRSRLTGTPEDLLVLDEGDDSLDGYWSEAEFLKTIRSSKSTV